MARAIDASGSTPAGDATVAAKATESDPAAGAVLDALFAQRKTRPATSKADFVRGFTDRWGIPCREYVQHILIGEDPVEASGTVCRAADGSWTLRE
jgi:hypothetical protein